MQSGLRRGIDNGTAVEFASTAIGSPTIVTGHAGITTPTPTIGAAQQLSTDRDLMVYVSVTTGGNFVLSIGATSACSVTLFTGTAPLGMWTVRLPRNWWISATSSNTGVWSANVIGA